MSTSAISSSHGVFPDWLTVSYAPSDALSDALADVLAIAGYVRVEGDVWSAASVWKLRERSPEHPALTGSVRFEFRERWSLCSVSGAALAVLDRCGALPHLLAAMMVEPSLRVTRLDLSTDLVAATPKAIRRRLLAFRGKGQRGLLRLGHKAIRPEQVRSFTTPRILADGAIVNTGTLYLGDRSNVFSAALYDKRGQMAEVHDIDIGYEALRVEVRIRKGASTLRDVVRPDALFFRLASPDLLERPADVPHWEYTEMDPRLLPPLERSTDYQRLMRLVENSSDLEVIRRMLEQLPTSAPLVIRKITDMLSAKSRDAA